MSQRDVWEREYRTKRLVSGAALPSQDVKDFARFLRKKAAVDFSSVTLLDLGSGVGKNAQYFAELGATVIGFEIARNALSEAEERARAANLSVRFEQHDIGTQYPLETGSIDIALDVMSSNSLSEKERAMYLSETARVMKPGGYFFLKCLAKEGDKNAAALLSKNPGREPDTYVMPELGLTERVFSEQDLTALYEPFFNILKKEKKTNYTRFEGRSYKRNYYLLYMQKRSDP
jgi:SAM-dependent methyltransferase